MVMEAPSPQCVGLEFVRQYYTILNKAPGQLHRFYASNSSFMHGGENSNRENIIGQTDIHKHILDMNFKDCHAKILLIDSQATLQNGVVIQVTGELSNDGRPMRRFMQTFVLAPQSEKKYYVHNDIFRYQDQVFNDGDEDEGPEDSLQDNGHSEELQPQLAPQEVVPAAAVAPVVQEASVPSGPGVPPGVGMTVQQQVVPEYPGVGSASHHQAVAVVPAAAAPASVHAAPQQPQQVLPSQQQPSQVAPSAVLPPQQQQAPQQQQLNGNAASTQDVTAAVAALSVAPLGGASAHPVLPHSPAPGVANLSAIERGGSLSKGQVQQHFAQQSVASAPAQPLPSQPQVIESNNLVQPSNPSLPQNSREDSWGPTDDWGVNIGQNDTWGEDNSSAPSQTPNQQPPAPRQQQQQLTNSRSSAASPPTKLPEKKMESPQPQQAPAQPQQPRSYAAFFKSNSGPGPIQQQPPLPTSQHSQYQSREIGSRSNNQQQQQSSQRERERESQPAPRDRDQQQQSRGGDRDQGNSGGFQRAGRGGRAVNSYRNRTSNYSESGSDRHNANTEENGNAMEGGYGGGRLEDRRRGPPPMSAPDSHQIFVGNLPQTVQEAELREVFSAYGAIQEVRINVGKGKLTGPSNGKPAGPVPNFGFVTFEDDQAVVNCLKSKPITINGDHRLNVEEKKTRSKMGGEGGGGYGGRPNNMRPPMHQQGGRGGFSRGEGGRGPRGAFSGPPRR